MSVFCEEPLSRPVPRVAAVCAPGVTRLAKVDILPPSKPETSEPPAAVGKVYTGAGKHSPWGPKEAASVHCQTSQKQKPGLPVGLEEHQVIKHRARKLNPLQTVL